MACLTVLRCSLLAVLVDLAGDEAAVGAAEEGPGELGAPGAHQAGETDDLAAADEEVRVLADQAVLDLRVAHLPVLDLEEVLADLGLWSGKRDSRSGPPCPDDAVLVDAVLLDVEGLDRLAVADDGDGVGDLLDLVELVAK